MKKTILILSTSILLAVPFAYVSFAQEVISGQYGPRVQQPEKGALDKYMDVISTSSSQEVIEKAKEEYKEAANEALIKSFSDPTLYLNPDSYLNPIKSETQSNKPKSTRDPNKWHKKLDKSKGNAYWQRKLQDTLQE